MEIKEVCTGSDLNDFIDLPWEIYKDDPNWVPPLVSEIRLVLDPKGNPLWKHAERKLFLAVREGKVVGRIAAIVNHRFMKHFNEHTGFFGFFESFDDYDIAELLLSAVKMYFRHKGLKVMRGPFNPSLNEEFGLLVEGFGDPPYVMMPHNPSYYQKFLEKFGLKKAIDGFAYLGPVTARLPKEISIASKFALTKCAQARIRAVNFNRFEEEVEAIRDVINASFHDSWGFVPLTEEEAVFLAGRLKRIAIPELALLAEIDGKPSGVLIGLPNFNQVMRYMVSGRVPFMGFLKLLSARYLKQIDAARLFLLGVKEECRLVGIEALLYARALENAHRLGYKWVEASMILENNYLARKAAEISGEKPYKTYRIYEMKIGT